LTKCKSPKAIAIVGIALRLPGDIAGLDGLWNALSEGRDLVTEIDASRWAVDTLQHPKRSEPGRSITFAAGALRDVGAFDAAFFGISPREAELMDPQQRLLLELSWDAIEDAGLRASTLRGSDCGVLVGISGLDYGMRVLDDLSSMSAHSMTGNTMSVAANRISYVFDLRGPSLAVDTACSSSLVALHQACELLRNGGAPLALAGGVNLLLHPYPFVGFTKASMLSARGRCRPFAADADGYVRAEGAAMLVLKPLRDALADGNRIHAVIRASGVNTDGARKSALTIPSADAQAELMRRVLGASGLHAADIAYVEAHGTGTKVGDPIEAAAIAAVYGADRATPLPIGSIKSNVGHLEPASGMAGLAKAIAVLAHREVPPTLHAAELNPAIDFDALNLELVRGAHPLPAVAAPLRVGVNSFGFGGVNAHVLLEQAPLAATTGAPAAFASAAAADTATGAVTTRPRSPSTAAPAAGLGATPLLFTAADADALLARAGQLAPLLQAGDDTAAAQLAQTLWERHDWLAERAALRDVRAAGAPAALRTFAAGGDAPLLLRERALPGRPLSAFVYSGNGAQWTGMGRALLAASPRFARVVDDVDARVRALGGPDLRAVLASDDEAVMHDTAVAQPALFALQVAATELLRSCGLHARAAMGHSVGEIAAAWAVGALDLGQACRVVVARSRAQALTRGAGRMAAVGLAGEAMQQRLHELGLADAIAVAAYNSPRNCTVSGAPDALQQLRRALRANSIFYRELDLDYAFHSPCMDPVRELLLADLAGLQAQRGSGSFFSSVTATALDGTALDADYWWRNVRDPVRFGDAVAALREADHRVFVEIGPHAILQRYIGETLDAARADGRALALAPNRGDTLDGMRDAVLRAALLGAEVDARAVFAQPLTAGVALPRYPWQRQRHAYVASSEAYALLQRHTVHPLLGYRLKEMPAAWEVHLDPLKHRWLADHVVGGAIVLAGAAYVEMALAAARETFGTEQPLVDALDIVAPVVFDGEHARTLRLLLDVESQRFRIEGRTRLSDDAWTLHAQGRLPGAVPAALFHRPIDARGAVSARIDGAQLYALAQTLGLDYGAGFRLLQAIEVRGDELVATLADTAHDPAWLLPPALLDQCFQSVMAWLAGGPTQLGFLPVAVQRLALLGPAAPARELRARLRRHLPRSALLDFELRGAGGEVLAVAEGCRFRAAALRPPQPQPARWSTALTPVPLEEAAAQAPLAPTAVLARAVRQGWQRHALMDRRRYLQEVAPLLELLPAAFARDALAAQGSTAATDTSLPARWAAAHPLLRHLLDELRRQGALEVRDDGWALTDTELPPTAEIWRGALAACPAAGAELLRIGRAGRQLPVLADTAPTAASAPDTAGLAPTLADASADALRLPAHAASLDAVRHLVAALRERWPATRRLRVLEIAAGDESLFDALRELLPADGVDYVIGRVDDADLAQLRATFAHDPIVQCTEIDAQTLAPDPLPGGPARFDLVVLHHALHRVAQPAQALAALLPLLAADAVLLLAERHPDQASDLACGTARDWWHGAAGAEHSSLLRPEDGLQLLQQLGWTDAQALLDPAADGLPLGSYVLLARPAPGLREAAPIAAQTWGIVALDAAHRDAADALASQLRAAEQHVGRVDLGIDLGADLATLRDAARHGATRWFVFPATDAAPSASAALAASCDTLRRTLLELAAAGSAARVHLVLPGGAPASPRPRPAAAALWGLARVAANELHPLELRLLDAAPDDTARLAAEALHADAEREIVLHGERRLAPRMQPAPDRQPAAGAAWRLDFTLPGQLRNLHWVETPRRELQPDEVEIEACAAGLNFRDVMYAMGLLADEALEEGFAGPTLGLEVAGRVARCGAAVRRFKPGDAVLAFAGASLASHVVVPERALARKPDAWSWADAATVPTVFFTVWYALRELARVRPGERVLIHGGAGGVGIAAIQLARHLGAEVLASAGSDDKRAFVQLLGADRVLDSRDAQFDETVLQLTAGEGVDVVLNSLAGDAIRRNLRVLRPFGRFVELGKRDFYADTAIGLRPFRNNISYFGVDADQLMALRPELAGALFADVMQLFADGATHPLPQRVFDADHVVDAFRHMQQARQIGKVVVDLTRPPRRVVPCGAPPNWRARADATYLVSGGMAGFGLATARWLAERGARHLLLLSRRGADTPGCALALEALRAQGVQVRAAACDVADRTALAGVLDDAARELPPLRGVVHAAMVLDDALLPSLDAERFARVLRPKLAGAWNLHELTRDLDLDLFVLYSSATTLLGNPGQANYVAANAALEALAAMRRAQGLAASAPAWGPIGDVGVLTGNALARDALRSRLGADPLSSSAALDALGELVAEAGVASTAVMDFDWGVLQQSLPSSGQRVFDTLRRVLQAGRGNAGDDDLRAELLRLDADAATQRVAELIAMEVAAILRLPPEHVGAGQALHDIGMDSLMAVELALALEKRLHVSLPPMLISENPTIARIAERVLGQLRGDGGPAADATTELVAAMASRHGENLSDTASLAADVRDAARQGTRLID
jgi:acyl transferase domain-containing protein/NADPH:quinone reductase-like Zn-dependent oxidoreductase/acyl carrier protein